MKIYIKFVYLSSVFLAIASSLLANLVWPDIGIKFNDSFATWISGSQFAYVAVMMLWASFILIGPLNMFFTFRIDRLSKGQVNWKIWLLMFWALCISLIYGVLFYYVMTLSFSGHLW